MVQLGLDMLRCSRLFNPIWAVVCVGIVGTCTWMGSNQPTIWMVYSTKKNVDLGDSLWMLMALGFPHSYIYIDILVTGMLNTLRIY